MEADELMPKLPKPQELRPFPTTPTIYYEGHQKRIRAVAVHKSGISFLKQVNMWPLEMNLVYF